MPKAKPKRRAADVPFAPPQWPAARVEMRALSQITPYPNNPRTHPESQIEKLAASMIDDGVTMPILIDEKGVIIAGHGRLLAARRAGFEEYPVVTALGWSEEQKRSVRIKDNQVALLSGWDSQLIHSEIMLLKTDGYDVGLLGFPEVQLRSFDISMGTDVVDGASEDIPPLPAKPFVRRGDLWTLGEHRLLCGDATDAKDVALVLGAEKPHLCVTDPPYGVKYNAAWRNDRVRSRDGKKVGGRATGKVANDDIADWRKAWALFHGDVLYAWSAAVMTRSVLESFEEAGFVVRAQIIWTKSRFAISRGDYHFQHEPCWYLVRRGGKSHWCGDRTQTTTWPIAWQKQDTGHSAQKPIECMKRPIENNSAAGDAVYEPFSGSGTTIIAAEMTKRRCLAIEIDPAYVQVAIERWQQVTGKAATLAGREFAAVAAARRRGRGHEKGAAEAAPVPKPRGPKPRSSASLALP